MCSDSNKREGWKEGKREKSKEKEGEGGREKVGRTRHRTVSPENNCRTENQEEGKRLCVTRTILISCFDFHKMSIILNHPGPPLLASYA